jgi:predicted nuclease with TOPRIM domain
MLEKLKAVSSYREQYEDYKMMKEKIEYLRKQLFKLLHNNDSLGRRLEGMASEVVYLEERNQKLEDRRSSWKGLGS